MVAYKPLGLGLRFPLRASPTLEAETWWPSAVSSWSQVSLFRARHILTPCECVVTAYEIVSILLRCAGEEEEGDLFCAASALVSFLSL